MEQALAKEGHKLAKKIVAIIGRKRSPIASMHEIKELAKKYKNSWVDCYSFDDFKLKLTNEQCSTLAKCKSAESEIRKQLTSRKALQPAILTECYIAKSLASMLELDEFIEVDEKDESVPMVLFETVLKYKGFRSITSPRYVYYSKGPRRRALLQYGDSKTGDAIYIDGKESTLLEFKEPLSKLEEIDLPRYSEEGKFMVEDLGEEYGCYADYITNFNSRTNIFEISGHNYKIDKRNDEDYRGIQNIVTSYFERKSTSLMVTQTNSEMLAILPENVMKLASFDGSEIRPAGRNMTNVFTPNKLREAIEIKGGKVDFQGNVHMPISSLEISKQRGSNKEGRYKINSLFFVRFGKAKAENETVSFLLSDIQQLRPTISVHLSF